jgi:hypothetical protein
MPTLNSRMRTLSFVISNLKWIMSMSLLFQMKNRA